MLAPYCVGVRKFLKTVSKSGYYAHLDFVKHGSD